MIIQEYMHSQHFPWPNGYINWDGWFLLLRISHGLARNTWLNMVSNFLHLLVQALSCSLVMPGWPLWSVCKHFNLNTASIKYLPFHMMHECSMARQSFSVQANLPTFVEWGLMCLVSLGCPFDLPYMHSVQGVRWVNGWWHLFDFTLLLWGDC